MTEIIGLLAAVGALAILSRVFSSGEFDTDFSDW
jgi:hypothetical protein